MVAVIDEERFRSTAAASPGKSGNGGGTVDDIPQRLSALESLVSIVRADVSAIKATIVHLATKAELADLRADIHSLFLSHEIRMIRWFVGTAIALVAAVFSIVRYLPA